MVDAAGALQAGLGRRLVEEIEAAALLAARLPGTVDRLELERLEQAGCWPRARRCRRARRGSPAGPARRGSRDGRRRAARRGPRPPAARGRAPRGRRSAGPPLALALDAVGAEPPRPEGERVLGGDPPDDPVDHAAPARPGAPRVLEEGEVGARVAALVGEEEVVDGRVVLVDRFLDQPQAQHPRVEIDVALSVLGDRGYVVNSL